MKSRAKSSKAKPMAVKTSKATDVKGMIREGRAIPIALIISAAVVIIVGIIAFCVTEYFAITKIAQLEAAKTECSRDED